MMIRINRREALTAGLAAPLAVMSGGSSASAAVAIPALLKNARKAKTAGYFPLPVEGALIGMLLPAVQKLRDAAARLQLFDSAGALAFEEVVPLDTRPTILLRRLANPEVGGTRLPHVKVFDGARAGEVVGEFDNADGLLAGLLVPAVQSGPAMLAGSVQLLGDGSVRGILPYMELDSLSRSDQGGHHFVGPFQLTEQNNTATIGLLLPAVQKVREAARLLIVNALGDVIAAAVIPTLGQSDAVATLLTLEFDSESMTHVRLRLSDGGGELLGVGPTPGGLLIGLLLPAVQSEGNLVPLLAGSLMTGGLTVPFARVSGLTGEDILPPYLR